MSIKIVRGEPDPRSGRHRVPDAETSIKGAKSVMYRSNSQKMILLVEYYKASVYGLTDYEAGLKTELLFKPNCCYWKRCSELRQDGFIRVADRTRMSPANEEQRVCVISQSGIDMLKEANEI